MPRTVLFLDTNIFLHFRPIDQVEWTRLFDADNCLIVIPRITVRELDVQKSIHSITRIRERARNALVLLEKCIAVPGIDIRKGTKLEYRTTGPTVDLDALGLEPSWADDVLVAMALSHRAESPDDHVVIVSDDTGIRLTARQHLLDARTLPDDHRRPSEVDEYERKIRELQLENTTLKGTRPKLGLGFIATSANRSVLNVIIADCPQRPTSSTIKSLLEPLAMKFPELRRDDTVLGAMVYPTVEEYERYAKERAAYLANYSEFAIKSWEHRCFVVRRVACQLWLQNTGGAPAEDIDIRLHIPNGIGPFGQSDLPAAPREPEPPRKPRTMGEILAEQLRIVPHVPDVLGGLGDLTQFGFGNVSALRITKSQSHDIDVHFDYIKHGVEIKLPLFFLTFDSDGDVNSFEIGYTISAANSSKPVIGSLYVVVARAGTDLVV